MTGGAAVTICDAPIIPFGASWGPDGEILIGAGAGGVLHVAGTGGTAAVVGLPQRRRVHQQSTNASWGQMGAVRIPSRHGTTEQGQAVVQSRATGERRVLIDGVRDVRYVPSGHLVYGRGNALLAQAFDPGRLTLSGGPVPVLDGVSNAGDTSPAMHVAVSSTGTLLYVPGAATNATALTKLVLVARNGTRSELADITGMTWFPRFSPDGSRVAYGVSRGTGLTDASDLWVLDVTRGARTRVTFTGNNRFYPIWTRDGARLDVRGWFGHDEPHPVDARGRQRRAPDAAGRRPAAGSPLRGRLTGAFWRSTSTRPDRDARSPDAEC